MTKTKIEKDLKSALERIDELVAHMDECFHVYATDAQAQLYNKDYTTMDSHLNWMVVIAEHLKSRVWKAKELATLLVNKE